MIEWDCNGWSALDEDGWDNESGTGSDSTSKSVGSSSVARCGTCTSVCPCVWITEVAGGWGIVVIGAVVEIDVGDGWAVVVIVGS